MMGKHSQEALKIKQLEEIIELKENLVYLMFYYKLEISMNQITIQIQV